MKRVRLLIVLLALCVPSHAFAALAVNSQMAAAAGGGITGNSVLTVSFTNSAGTYALCGVSIGHSAAISISSVTYAAVSMGTALVSVGFDGATHNFAQAAIYGLASPATGANNLVVTVSISGGSTGIEAGCISFTGQDLSTPIVAGSAKTNFRESSAATATVVSGTTTTGNIVVAQMATGTAYSSTSQTLTWSKNQNTLSAGGAGAMTYASGTGGTITMTDNITSDFMGMVCVEVAAAGGGPPACTPTMGLMGVGRCGDN